MIFKFYLDNLIEWRWELWAEKRLVATSVTGFTNRIDCAKDAERFGYIGN